MANRIQNLFGQQQTGLLSVYFTAGYPSLEDTVPIILELEKNGVDLIEVGMPFSDPLADGPTIQQSSEVAIRNGMTIPKLFEQLKDIRQHTQIPLVLMGYLNPVMQYGVERFLKKASEIGIDGIILPDLPLSDYVREYKPLFEVNGLSNIFLVTPQTPEQRIREIDEHSNGFIYMVSSASVTGSTGNKGVANTAYFQRVAGMALKNPGIIGFGIHDCETFTQACSHASGAIIGSAFIKALGKAGDLAENISTFIQSIRKKQNA
ncbi:tryptophan synthase subunit alpha [Pontibacter sp. JH31]|uniref:Tryptophan synthase alpha chain n=1 Tax=Pontibacter aquaedesilientis TaxID=2766980 RepID=A0ABR7XCP4_9BACT|nr:tryptophan synthase subunit alpha [Pontibacter aquaedesilientis]MBD1396059.1 tryptophan synthase subunit alpha [Pontibacter aquaedesilientis]